MTIMFPSSENVHPWDVVGTLKGTVFFLRVYWGMVQQHCFFSDIGADTLRNLEKTPTNELFKSFCQDEHLGRISETNTQQAFTQW